MEERVMQGKEPTSENPQASSSTATESNIPTQKKSNTLVWVSLAVIVIAGIIIAAVIGVGGSKSEKKVSRSTAETETTIEITETAPTVTYSNNTCKTDECFEAAKKILETMNASINPCVNFYEFVCGKWMKKYPLKGIEIRKLTSDIMYDNYKQKLSNLLKNTTSGTVPKHVEILQSQYDTCLHTGTNVTVGLEYLQNALQELGGWPVFVGPTWNENGFNLIDTLAKIYKMGLGQEYLFEFSIGRGHEARGGKTEIIIEKPNFAMDPFFYDKTKEKENRLKYIKKIKSDALRLGLDLSNKDEELGKIFEFVSKMFHEWSNDTWKRAYVFLSDQNIEEVSGIDWKKFVKDVVGDVDPHQIVDFRYFSYMTALKSLISKKREVANYLIWRIIQKNTPYLLKGDCEAFILENLGIAYSSLYVRTYFNENFRKSASVILSYIREAMKNDLNNIEWMVKEDQDYGKDKVTSTSVLFPFPGELLNATFIDHYYENLNFGNVSCVMNLVNIKKWQAQISYKLLRTNPGEDYWMYHVRTKEEDVKGNDVFVYTFQNILYISSALLQDPTYNVHLPMIKFS